MTTLQAAAEPAIKGGYYLKARCIQDAEIATAPPHVREIWDWLLKETNHAEAKVTDTIIMRGQCIRSYKEIQEGLHWMIGWRKCTYSKTDCETAMKWLTKREMITIQKTTRGMIVTICKYDYYQNPAHYENHNEADKRTTRKPQSRHTINKNEKNKENENSYSQFEIFWNEYPKKVAKQDAIKAWNKIQFSDGLFELIINKVKLFRETPDWKKENGQFVPMPATWLNGKRWQDEIPNIHTQPERRLAY
jgi:hypothetical protein